MRSHISHIKRMGYTHCVLKRVKTLQKGYKTEFGIWHNYVLKQNAKLQKRYKIILFTFFTSNEEFPNTLRRIDYYAYIFYEFYLPVIILKQYLTLTLVLIFLSKIIVALI